jgi:hypothetical protein
MLIAAGLYALAGVLFASEVRLAGVPQTRGPSEQPAQPVAAVQ